MHIDSDKLVGTYVSDRYSEKGTVTIVLTDGDSTPTREYTRYKYVQTEQLTAIGVAVKDYGAILVPETTIELFTNGTLNSTDFGVFVRFNDEYYSVSLSQILATIVTAPVEFEESSLDDYPTVTFNATLPPYNVNNVGQVPTVDENGVLKWEILVFKKGSGDYSIIPIAPSGHEPVASGFQAIALGYETISSGIDSFAGGNKIVGQDPVTASGEQSFAYGASVKATGNRSVAFGEVSEASGIMSFAMGNTAKAQGVCSIAFGQKAEAQAGMSAAFGNYTIATGRACMVVGQYNIADDNAVDTSHGAGARKYILIVGNGTSANNRSNALTIDWNGNGIFTGNVNAKNIPSPPTTDGEYVLKCTVTNGTPTYSWVSST